MTPDLLLRLLLGVVAASAGLLSACSDDESTAADARACDAEPEVLTTADGVEFVRTPEACFGDLPDWPYEPRYVEIDGLRQAYVDEGPSDGEVILLLHGQPSWSYLYRKMIPVLVDAGYRVIAVDHLGMGRSDKPTSIESYSYLNHSDRLQRFIEHLDLRDINLFVQDWGAAIGLRVAGLDPQRYARIAVGNGQLPVVPEGIELVPPVSNPDEVADIPSPYASIPPQQEPFYDACRRIDGGDNFTSFDWALKGESFHPAHVIEALTWFDLPEAEEAAYDAPYPSRAYMAGTRVFASLRADFPGLNQDAWANLTAFERPFLTIWAGNDPKETGSCELQNQIICSVAGAQGQAHVRLSQASHFLQDDQGEAIAARLIAFFRGESSSAEYITDCGGGPIALPVAEDGTGTPCMTDVDCVGLVAATCLTDGTNQGFCTVEMVAAGLLVRRGAKTRPHYRLGRGQVDVKALPRTPKKPLVFPSRTGTYREPSALTDAMQKVAAELGIEQSVGCQVVRRTFNTLMLAAGVDRIVLRSQMGHCSEEMTERYAGVDPELKREAVELIEGQAEEEA